MEPGPHAPSLRAVAVLVMTSRYPGGLTELCPATGSGAAPKGHGGPTVTGDQGAMAALRSRGAEKRWIDAYAQTQVEDGSGSLRTVPPRESDRRWSRVASYSHFRSNAWGCRLAGTRPLLGSSASLPLAPLSATQVSDKGLTEVLTSPNKPPVTVCRP